MNNFILSKNVRKSCAPSGLDEELKWIVYVFFECTITLLYIYTYSPRASQIRVTQVLVWFEFWFVVGILNWLIHTKRIL